MEESSDENTKQKKFILIFRVLYLFTIFLQIFACVFSNKEFPEYIAFPIGLIYFSLPIVLLLFNMNYKTENYTYNNIIGFSIFILLGFAIAYITAKDSLGGLAFYYIFFVLFVLILTGKYTLTEKLN